MVLSYCLTYIGGILCHKFSYVLIANLKKKILFHIGNLPLGFFTGDNKSKIRQVLGSDMNQIEGYFSHQLPNLISTLALILAMIIVMLKINLILGLTTLLIIFVGLGIQIAIMAKIIKSGGLEKNFAILDQINSATTEYVKGMPEVKIFGTGAKPGNLKSKTHWRICTDVSFHNTKSGRILSFTLKSTKSKIPAHILRLYYISDGNSNLWNKAPQARKVV